MSSTILEKNVLNGTTKQGTLVFSRFLNLRGNLGIVKEKGNLSSYRLAKKSNYSSLQTRLLGTLK